MAETANKPKGLLPGLALRESGVPEFRPFEVEIFPESNDAPIAGTGHEGALVLGKSLIADNGYGIRGNKVTVSYSQYYRHYRNRKELAISARQRMLFTKRRDIVLQRGIFLSGWATYRLADAQKIGSIDAERDNSVSAPFRETGVKSKKLRFRDRGTQPPHGNRSMDKLMAELRAVGRRVENYRLC